MLKWVEEYLLKRIYNVDVAAKARSLVLSGEMMIPLLQLQNFLVQAHK
jgi:hypothetical protein